MDGLPFIPGFRYRDITKRDYSLSSQYRWKNGYAIPKDKSPGIAKDVDSVLYAKTLELNSYNPEMTYGKVKDPPKPMTQPKFILLDGKQLTFNGYTRLAEMESPTAGTYRVRRVKITYFLVDDTITINEPVVENAGYVQGCVLKRGLIPNPNRKNRNWHWSDLNNDAELDFYGVIYKLCNCDLYTKNYLSVQGVAVKPDKPVPDDPYMVSRWKSRQQKYQSLSCDNPDEDYYKHKQLKDDGKILRFYIVWEHDEPEEWKFYVLLYFMADERIVIYDSKDKSHNKDRNLFPTFLSKIKLPKDWAHLPSIFSSINLESKNKDFQKYYQPKDFMIGNSIFVMGRRFLVYDCDLFTRSYFKENFKIDQPDPLSSDLFSTDKDPTIMKKKVIPPYTGIGDPDDTRQNCLSLRPKPPKTLDFAKYVLNAAKKLRYKLKMIPVYEVDKFRKFIMEFCLGNDKMNITELADNNSGFSRGRFMASIRLRKPGTSVDDNDFYGTKDFGIGTILYAKGSVFEIIELDLFTYTQMIINKDMFTQDAIDGAKKFLESKGSIIPLHTEQNIDIESKTSTIQSVSPMD